MLKRIIPLGFYLLMLGSFAAAQENPGAVDRLTVPFSDPGKPGLVEVGLVNGSITVTGYDETEVIVEARSRTRRLFHRDEADTGGMIRITLNTTGLSVEEEDNVMEIETQSWKRSVDIDIRVPFKTSLKLSTVNSGDITVKNVSGEIDVNNVNGKVTLESVSGSVIAHALNKDLVVTLNQVSPDKFMSFSSLNGDIDVTLPASLKANVKLESDNGDIFSDFELQINQKPRQVVEENRQGESGKYRVRIDSAIEGTIGGGGQEIMFKSFQGDIYIRKAR